MPYYYITETNFDPSVITKYEKLLHWFEKNLSTDYHIFLEFKVPAGREIDFLILANDGAWLIEHKQHDFVEILCNGNWKFLDRWGRRRELIKPIKRRFENPYDQASNSGDSFRDWLFNNRSIATDLERPKRIYPCVAFPDSKTDILVEEHDNWCYFSKGTVDIQNNFRRKWNRRDYISEETIMKISEALNLQQISFSDLIQHRANLEKIFRDTGLNQVKEIKTIFSETNQLKSTDDWIFSIQLREDTARSKNLSLRDLSLEYLPFFIVGKFGSGKSIACIQIMESFLHEAIGFILPVRDIVTTNIDETSKKILFKGNNLVFPVNIEQDPLENINDDITNIITFLIESLIQTYNKNGLIEQVTPGISKYLLDQRFFLIFDGWDEISSGSFSIMKKLLDYCLVHAIPVTVSCRSPLDNYLKQLKIQDKSIPHYITLPLSDEQIYSYITQRLKVWITTISVERIAIILRETFKTNITPFHLYATTIVPIEKPPENSAQLIRWMVIAQIGWELLKERKDYVKDIKTLQDLIQILEKEKMQNSQKETSLYDSISEFQKSSNEIFPNGSVRGIVGKIALAEINGTNIELSGSAAMEINPLITPFIELIPHPEGLYLYPRVKTKMLQEYFIAERVLEELVTQGKIIPLITLDVYFLFSQLLEIDVRWKASLKAQGKEDDVNILSVQYLTTYPVKLRPTIQKPDFELIGGGMRMVQSRMRLGIPEWYRHLLSACINKIKNLSTFSSDSVSQTDAIIAFLQLQQTVPEMTSDRIYDSFIKDDDEPQFSQSLDPEHFLKNIVVIFSEYQEKRSTIMDKIDAYCRQIKAEEADREKEKQDTEEDEDWYDYPIDTYFCDGDTYKKLSFLFSVLEYSGSTGLKRWAELVISDISLSGGLISYLLLEKIPLTVLNSLLLRYQQLISSYIDSELGVLQPGDYDFDEEIIIKSLIRNTILGAPQKTLETFWILLLHYSNDLNLIELLFNNLELFDINTLSSLYRITLLHYFDDYPKKKPQVELLIQYIDKLKPISMILTYEDFISLSSKRIPITQDELHWLLNENLDKITEDIIKRNSTKNWKLLMKKKDFNSLDSKNQLFYLLNESNLKDRPSWEVRERFEIFKIALLYELEIEPTDLAAIILEFDQINWILQFLDLEQVNITTSFKRELFSSLSPKIKAFKILIEEKSFNPMKIAFYRLVTRQSSVRNSYDIQLTDKEVESWLRESLIHEEKMMNDDWMAIEKLISSRLLAYFKNSEFKDYFSEIIKNDTEAKVNPKHIVDIMFPSYFYNNMKDDRYNWKVFNKLITDDFFSRTLEITMNEPDINAPVFSLVLYAYPYRRNEVDNFLLEFFDEKSSEKTSVYRSNVTRLLIRLMNFNYFEAVINLISHVSIDNLVFIVYTLRKMTFPEDSNETIQVTPTLTNFANKFSLELSSMLDLIINRLYNKVDKIENMDHVGETIDYCFDLLIGLQSEKRKELLKIFFLLPIYHYHSVDWINHEIRVIIDSKEEFHPLLTVKRKWLSKKKDETTRPFEIKEIANNIERIDSILSYFDNKIGIDELKIAQIDGNSIKPFMKRDYSKYQPSTTTQDWNDFSEAIEDLTYEERLNFLIRLMYGREIIVIEDEVIIKESFDPKNRYKTLYPNNKNVGMEILLNSLNPDEILEEGRRNDEISRYQWFGFLNYFIENSSLETVKNIQIHFEDKEFNISKISLILQTMN